MHRASGVSARRCASGLWLVCLSILLCGLAACSSSRPGGYSAAQLREYAPPGPPSDPWGPYIREASARFGVPETWIREVMRRESGGRQYIGGALTTSSRGAMGLMQVMPATYEELRQRLGLDADGYHPYNNILAGTAYIREMYDRFGFPGFLAAYNAGPRRLEDYLYAGRPLPGETTAYLAAVAPRLAGSAEAWGPLATYASLRPEISADALNRSALAALPHAGVTPAVASVPAPHRTAAAGSPADALNRRVLEGAPPGHGAPASYGRPAPPPADYAGVATAELNRDVLRAQAAAQTAADGPGIQVGAFSSPAQARAAADRARAEGGGLLRATQAVVSAVTRPDGLILYRAWLVGLSPAHADAACDQLTRRGVACIVLAPDRLT